ncbi:MAG TPA: Lrp/AsnC family transcriptional regulator [Burkholderiales bacterium]|nr:Lrp/AsnC family transcriptional regulator [Burkholderiales bacterium]
MARNKPAGDVAFRFGESDALIIEALQKDARAPVKAIAERLRMPVSSVRHRVQKLVQAGILEFAAMTNPLRMGYQIWAQIEVQAELARIEEVAQRLAAAPEVYLVGITNGRYDIHVGAAFRTNEEFLEFITTRMARIPGIVRVSSSPMLRVVKRSFAFPFPRPAARRGRPAE